MFSNKLYKECEKVILENIEIIDSLDSLDNEVHNERESIKEDTNINTNKNKSYSLLFSKEVYVGD